MNGWPAAPKRACVAVAGGATEVIQPELEAASTLIRHALRQLALPRDETLEYLTRFREAMDAGTPAGAPSTEAMPEVREVTIGPGLADRSLRDAQMRERFGAIVVILRRIDGEVIRHPSPDAILRAGDTVRVFGLRQQIDALAKAMEREEP
jgi:K+/H+ antiporter YhaU regulatory subunit KhtT